MKKNNTGKRTKSFFAFFLTIALFSQVFVMNVSAASVNWNLWNLQLPNNTTVTSGLSTFSNTYFKKTSSGTGHTFMVPKTGTPTSGSKYVRTEMRQKQNWTWTGTNTLTTRVQVTKNVGSIAVGQVFCEVCPAGSHALSEIFYGADGTISIFYAEAKGAGTTTKTSVKIPVGTTFGYRYQLNGGTLKVFIQQGSGTAAYTEVFSRKLAGGHSSTNKFYFKFGNYDQSTSAGTLTTTAHSSVNFFSAQVEHK